MRLTSAELSSSAEPPLFNWTKPEKRAVLQSYFSQISSGNAGFDIIQGGPTDTSYSVRLFSNFPGGGATLFNNAPLIGGSVDANLGEELFVRYFIKSPKGSDQGRNGLSVGGYFPASRWPMGDYGVKGDGMAAPLPDPIYGTRPNLLNVEYNAKFKPGDKEALNFRQYMIWPDMHGVFSDTDPYGEPNQGAEYSRLVQCSDSSCLSAEDCVASPYPVCVNVMANDLAVPKRGTPPEEDDVSSFALPDEWNCLEFRVKLNSFQDDPLNATAPRQPSTDGELAMWLNGELQHDHKPGYPSGAWYDETFQVFEDDGSGSGSAKPFPGFQWRKEEGFGLNWLALRHYVPNHKRREGVESFSDYSHLVMATKRIGCLPTTPTFAPTASPTASAICRNVSLGGSQLTVLSCDADPSGGPSNGTPTRAPTSAVLPPTDEDGSGPGIVVGPVVDIVALPNVTISDENPAVFSFPFFPEQVEEAVTRLKKKSGPCDVPVLQCEWKDDVTGVWSPSGCTSVAPSLDFSSDPSSGSEGAVSCSCSHLTVFSVILRSKLDPSPGCHAQNIDFVLALIYLPVLLLALGQLAKLNYAMRASKASASGSSSLRNLMLQHLAVALGCGLRPVQILLKSTLSPAVLASVALTPSFLQATVLAHISTTWSAITLFSLRGKQTGNGRGGFRKLAPLLLCLLFLLFMTTAGPSVYLAIVMNQDKPDSILDFLVMASYAQAGTCLLVCLVVLVSGVSIYRIITKTKLASSHVSNSEKQQERSVESRILLVSSCCTISLLLQAGLWVASVKENVLSSTQALFGIAAAFHTADIVTMLLLLYLFASPVKKRYLKERMKRSRKSSGGVENELCNRKVVKSKDKTMSKSLISTFTSSSTQHVASSIDVHDEQSFASSQMDETS